MEKTYKLRIGDEVAEIIPFTEISSPLLRIDCTKIIFREEHIGYFTEVDYETDLKMSLFFEFIPSRKYTHLIKSGTLYFHEESEIFEISDGENIIQRFKLNLTIEEITA